LQEVRGLTHESIWENVLDYVRENVTSVEYDTWFARVKPLGVTHSALELGVPTSFAGDWIQKHYGHLIQEALLRLGARSPEFRLKVVPSGEEPPPAEEPPRPSAPSRTRLNPKYTFESFVVGPGNSMAHAAAMAVAEAPGKAYNPLFIYGGVGLGKTHLMHAVGHYARQRFPEIRVEYVSTETFTNDLISAIRSDRMNQFRERYRSVDMLLVDDVQFIAGKERTQEEFFHTFNTLYEDGKQILLTSDRPPREILTLESRLRSRFEWGLITDIQPPDLETRIAILKMNAERRGVRLGEDVLEYVARQVASNIRELEGALMRLIAYASLSGVEITPKVAAGALADLFHTTGETVTMDEILAAVAEHYGVTPADLKSKGRSKEVVRPRQVAMYLIRQLTGASLPEIGQFFGGRDHTTVLYATQKIGKLLAEDAELRRTVEGFEKRWAGRG
jgi:chromosomal replication initiator protein